MKMRLKYLSNSTVDQLKEGIRQNLGRYRQGSFEDLMADGEWNIELTMDVDLTPLAHLDPSISPASEVANSRLIWRVLGRLPASVAYEEGLWARLTHVECLGFTRTRWISNDLSEGELGKSVTKHFFAGTLTQRRDDNAISRLWWNAYIARGISTDDDLDALPVLLKSADIRSNIIERRRTGSRPVLAAGLVRIMRKRPAVTSSEDVFRNFMKAVNKYGGGILFEALTDAEIDKFLEEIFSLSHSSVNR